MGKVKNLDNQRFGKLVVIRSISGGKKECQCDCGRLTNVFTNKLLSGHTRSCGCLQKEMSSKINGLCKTRLHKIWESMHARCECKKHKSYKIYKKIKICDDWHKSNKHYGFINFYHWSMSNGYNDDLTIDRIDGNKGYSPENCRWTTYLRQNQNLKRNVEIEYNGKTKCKAEWCRDLGVSLKAVDHCKSRYGLTYQQIFERYTKQFFNTKTQLWEDKHDQ